MGLGNYISELLKENETVIIPGFGAFFLEYKPAEIRDNEIKPPSKTISFSSNIRNNDGLLVGHVANVEKVSHFDALKIIEKERDKIVFQLDKGGDITLEGTGKLQTNEKNEIVFTPVFDANLSVESIGLEAVSIEKLKEEPPEEILTNNDPSEDQIQDSSETAHTNVTDDLHEEPLEIIEENTSITQELETMEDSNESDEKDPVSEEEKFEPELAAPVFLTLEPNPEKKNKKKPGWYWYLLILIPIIIAGVFVTNKVNENKPELSLSNENEIQQNTPNETELPKQAEVIADSSQLIEEEVLLKDTTTTSHMEEISETDINRGEKIYYLIGGSFKEEDNAMEYIEELTEKGFEPFYMGKRGNFYMVGVGKYATEGQAVRAREVFWEKNPGAGLWVMEE